VAADEFRLRRERVSAEFGERKLDALIVSFAPNLRYLTGFTGSNGLFLALPGGDGILFTDPRYTIQSKQEVSCRVRICTTPLLPQLIAAMSREGVHQLGVEAAHMTFAQHDTLRSALPLGVALAPVSGWLEQHRMTKSPAEIAAIRRSVETNSTAFERAVRHARAGMREADLAAELDYRMRLAGAEGTAFETIVATGVRSALPHARPTGVRLANGDLVVVDMGAMQDGYSSDMTRMLFLGRPGAKVKRLYGAVLEAQLAAIAAVRPGVTAMQVDRAARRVLKAEKLEKAFVHSTGHGLGLEIHEPPRLGKNEKLRLTPGMAITIEPGVYLEGFGGIRIEDTVVVTPSGCEILTPTPKNLRLVE
jgi:Xaa-Pro aminopeptidase